MSNDLVAFSLEQLYPISTDMAVTALTQSVLTWEKNVDGKHLLERELTGNERRFLAERRGKLAHALVSAPEKEIRKCVSRMMMGFLAGKDVSDENAKAIVTQYIATLRGLPFWAIERACQKFSRGEIAAIRDESVKLAFGPSTAQLYQVASQLCGEFYNELTDVDRALNGVVEHKASEEERRRVSEGFRDLARHINADIDADRPPRWYEKPLTQEDVQRINDDLVQTYGKKNSEDDTSASV